MYRFDVIDPRDLDMEEYNAYSRKSVFTTMEWMDFVREDSHAEAAIIRILRDDGFIGYVPMMFVTKFGIKIAGSPFRGWSTCWMGIETEDAGIKTDIIKELIPYLFKKHRVMYCEITDRDVQESDLIHAGIKYVPVETLELEIDRSDEELWKTFKGDCRNFIRQFERRGGIIEHAEPNDVFAEEYYSELVDVFAKQGMRPTYSCKKVKCLLRNMKGSGNVLCLRVTTPDHEPAATSIFFCDKNRFYFWGGASFREHQHYRPNEAMLWEAIQYFRKKGLKYFDMVGNRSYKLKFGPEVATYYTMRFARFKVLFQLRDWAEKLYFARLKKDKPNA